MDDIRLAHERDAQPIWSTERGYQAAVEVDGEVRIIGPFEFEAEAIAAVRARTLAETQEPASGVTVRFGDGDPVPFEAAERAMHDEAQADASAQPSDSGGAS